MSDEPNDPDAGRAGKRAKTYSPVPEWILLSGISPQAMSVYAVLLAHTNREDANGRSFPGLETIAEILGFKQRKSVSNYLRELVEIRAIKVTRKETGAKRHNEYVVYERPPAGLKTPETLQGFYDNRRATRSATGTGVPLATGTQVPLETGTPVPQNQRNSTRGREPEEFHASGGDAPAGAHEQARGRATDQPSKRIHIVYPVAADEAEMTRKLVAAAAAAMKRAEKPLGSEGTKGLGQWFQKRSHEPVDRVAADLERVLTAALAGDTDYAWLFQDLPKPASYPNTADGFDQLNDDLNDVPGGVATIFSMAGNWHPNAIANTAKKNYAGEAR